MAPRNRRDQTKEGSGLPVYPEDSGFHSERDHEGDKVRRAFQ